MNNLLDIRELQTYIGQFHILQGVSMSVPAGATTVILGRNGAGKTTTLRSIMGVAPPREGRISFDGQDITRMLPYRIAQLGIGYVPEDRGVFTGLTVEENLRLAERSRDALRRRRELIYSLFPDLRDLARRKAGALSGGQQQMLAIARALANENRLLLIDEPSKGLAPIIIQKVTKALQEIKSHTTILMVEQNFLMASLVGDYFVIIDDGKSVLAGSVAELAADRQLQQKYLGVGAAGEATA